MTNSSPQEPQNPVPERRQRPAAGVTFDEMIAIVVAFSTIGAILFWSLGGRRNSIVSNLLGDSNNILSSGNNLAANIADPDARLNFGDVESESSNLEIADNSAQLRSVPLAAPSGDVNLASGIESQSYSFDRTKEYTPLAGIATSPAIINNSNVNLDEDTATNEINTGNGDIDTSDTSIVTAPDRSEGADTEQPAATAPEMPDDIAPTYWAYPFVEKMNEKLEIAEFADDQNFEPDKLITRAGMATLISQAFEMQPANENIKKFKDVSNQNAIAADVDKAVRIGFMQGYSDEEFRPLENIPRYQVLVALATGLGLQPSQAPEQILQKFTDGDDLPDWAKEQVAAAAEAGLIVNAPNSDSDALNPLDAATRAEVAAMIHQALVESGKLQPLESEYIVE